MEQINQKRIAVIGSINMDYVTNVKRQPQIGETVPGNGLSLKPGGKGANQAYAAAYLGGLVTMLGVVGNDEAGRLSIASLKQAGVCTDYIKILPEVNTGTAFIAVNEEGDNSIIVIPGANSHVDRSYVDSVMPVIRESDFVIFQLEIPLDTVNYAVKKAKEYGKQIILDPAPAQRLDRELLNGIDIVKPNQTEVLEVMGQPAGKVIQPEEELIRMREVGVRCPIITLGSKGSCALDEKGQLIQVPAAVVKAVDTTGAGDCFTGAMAYCLSLGKNLSEAMRFAGMASAVSVTRQGAQPSFPTLEEVLEFSSNQKNF